MDERIGSLFKSANERFAESFGSLERCRFAMAPASLMFLGDHTHYNDGVLLSTSVNRYVVAVGRKRKDSRILLASDFSDTVIDVDNFKKELNTERFTERFIYNIFSFLREKELLCSGFEIVVASDIPDAMGLGASSAYQIAILKLINSLCRLKLSPTTIGELSRSAEMKLVHKVSNDAHHKTILYSKNNSFIYNDLRTKTHRNIPVNMNDTDILLIDTEVEIVNSLKICLERVEECTIGSDTLKMYMWGIKNLRDITDEFLQKKVHMLPKRVFQRLTYNVGERIRVEEALKDLFNNDLASFGSVISNSHKSISSDYLLSSAEIDYLVAESTALKGVIGAKMVSCSPIRCLFVLVNKEDTESCLNIIKEKYYKKYERDLSIYKLKNASSAKLFKNLNKVLA